MPFEDQGIRNSSALNVHTPFWSRRVSWEDGRGKAQQHLGVSLPEASVTDSVEVLVGRSLEVGPVLTG